MGAHLPAIINEARHFAVPVLVPDPYAAPHFSILLKNGDIMTRLYTRRAVVVLAAAALTTAVPAALAQKPDYPNHPVKVVVPFVPGGNADSTARIFAEAYAKLLGQSFIVENRGGAGGMIGALQVVRAEPDGYTVLISTTGPIVSSWQLAGKAAAYSLADLKPVALLTKVPDVLVVNASSSFKTYADLAGSAKKRSDIKFGHPGNGTAGHVNILQMQKALGAKFILAGYKGSGPALRDLLGGQLDVVATDLPSVLPFVKAGKLRALGVVFPQRVSSLPDVPTMAEVHQPEVDIAPFAALMVPRNVPAGIVARLAEASKKVLADTTVRQRVAAIGGIPVNMSGADLDAFLKGQVATYADLIKSGLLTTQ
jgi:tripartite-type tricarboxylate transporter receptor subunit TctC